MKVIIVSGTPGTGKTALSKKLAKKLNFYYFDVNKIISKYKLSEGYDKKRKTKIIDISKLNKKLIDVIVFFKKYNFIEIAPMSSARRAKLIKKITLNDKSNKPSPLKNRTNKNIKKYNGIIIDSHLSHYLPRKYADVCIVTKCDIKELNKRLKKKKYYKTKIEENLQAEIFDICLNEAKERKHKVMILDTTKDFNIRTITKKVCG